MNGRYLGGLFAFLFVLCSFSVLGATIEGNVYTFNLEPALQSIVEIDTTPQQQIVATDGSYELFVPEGSYTITAKQVEYGEIVSFVEESVDVSGDGDYTLDLILFPSFAEEEDLLEDAELELETPVIDEDASSSIFWSVLLMGGILFGLIVLFRIFLYYKKAILKDFAEEREKESKESAFDGNESDDDLESVVAYLHKHKRITQKELRKQFPYSEAKISLIVSDLEDQGRIKKIKKGRGNILVFLK